jgi:glucokinase
MGGTKTLIGLFRRGRARPEPAVVREYATLDFDSLDEIVGTFVEETGTTQLDAACIGAAGPVSGLVARLTNVPWPADATPIAHRLGGGPIELLNDLEAMAHVITVLEPDEVAALQEGVPVPTGNAALIAAGTGLGQAFVHNINGRFVPAASEGGHADFAARTPRELALVQELTLIHGRVDVERVVSGHGLINLFLFTHGTQDARTACRVLGPDVHAIDLPAAITHAALTRQCEQCMEALDMFVEAYGAESGNLALRCAATAGVYIGGGIAPKILPALQSGLFMNAFLDKAPLADWLRTIPVGVILNQRAGLLGAAVRAQDLTR